MTNESVNMVRDTQMNRANETHAWKHQAQTGNDASYLSCVTTSSEFRAQCADYIGRQMHKQTDCLNL